MAIARRRPFGRLILGRLTWAWLAAGVACVVVGAVFINAWINDDGAGRIALPVEQLENFARGSAEDEQEADEDAYGLRLSAPNLRDGANENVDPYDGFAANAYGDDTTDLIGEGREITPAPEFSESDIVITIAGEQQKSNLETAETAKPQRRARPIPDPEPSLLRATPLGKVPRVASDGRKAVNVYAHTYAGNNGDPKIALIVGGLGLNPTLTERAIDELPASVSLSFAPYAKDLEFWTKKARDAGHEILIELPMEGYGGNQEALGAAALLSSRSSEENLQRLDWLLSRFGGYFAATNYMGAKFSTDDNAMSPVLQKLREAGIGYIDSTGAAARAKGANGLPIAVVNETIHAANDESGRRTVKRELARLEQVARRNGSAIGKTYAYAGTLEEIIAWTEGLEEKKLSAAPASSILRKQAATR